MYIKDHLPTVVEILKAQSNDHYLFIIQAQHSLIMFTCDWVNIGQHRSSRIQQRSSGDLVMRTDELAKSFSHQITAVLFHYQQFQR